MEETNGNHETWGYDRGNWESANHRDTWRKMRYGKQEEKEEVKSLGRVRKTSSKSRCEVYNI